MYDMPFIPPTKEAEELVKCIQHVSACLNDLEERILVISEQLDYLDAQAYNIELQLNSRPPEDDLGNAYEIPDGRLPC